MHCDDDAISHLRVVPDDEVEAGRREEEADIEAARWKIYFGYGFDDVVFAASEIVSSKCGLKISPVHSFSCIIVGAAGFRRHYRALGYNARILEALVSRFGRDSWSEAELAAKEEERRGEYEPRRYEQVPPDVDVPTFIRWRRSRRENETQ